MGCTGHCRYGLLHGAFLSQLRFGPRGVGLVGCNCWDWWVIVRWHFIPIQGKIILNIDMVVYVGIIYFRFFSVCLSVGFVFKKQNGLFFSSFNGFILLTGFPSLQFQIGDVFLVRRQLEAWIESPKNTSFDSRFILCCPKREANGENERYGVLL